LLINNKSFLNIISFNYLHHFHADLGGGGGGGGGGGRFLESIFYNKCSKMLERFKN